VGYIRLREWATLFVVLTLLLLVPGPAYAEPQAAVEEKPVQAAGPAPKADAAEAEAAVSPKIHAEPRVAPSVSEIAPEIVAEVNGVQLRREQLAALAVGLHGRESLESLITQELVRQEARKRGVVVTEEEIASYTMERAEQELLRMIRKLGFKDAEDFKVQSKAGDKLLAELQQEAAKSIRPFVGPELLARKLVRQRINVSDDAVRAAYSRRYGPRVEVLQIVLNTRKEAEQVLAKLKLGAEFAQVAREMSRDSVSAPEGGKIPPLPLAGKLGAATEGLKPGEISNIVQTPDGFHILKLIKPLPDSPVRFEQVRASLRKALEEKAMLAERAKWLRELRSKAVIQRRF